MKKILTGSFLVILFTSLLIIYHGFSHDAYCQEHQIKHIDFLVENVADHEFSGVVWINAREIYSLIPDFDGFSFIVTTTHSPNLQTDLGKNRADELESQPEDTDGDGKIDRIGIYLFVQALEKKIITVHVGEMNRILRIKGQYKYLCNAIKLEDAIFWESDRIAYRYDLPGNYISVIGKMTQRNILKTISASYYKRGQRSFLGEEIMINQKAPGFGVPGILKKEIISGLNNYRRFKIISDGPLSATFGASAGAGKSMEIDLKYTLTRGSRWTEVDMVLSGTNKEQQFITAIPVRKNENITAGKEFIATYNDDPGLGLAIYVPQEYFSGMDKTGEYHVLKLKPDSQGKIRYAFAAFWEYELYQNVVYPEEVDIKVPEVVYSNSDKRLNRVLVRPDFKMNDNGDLIKELTDNIELQFKKRPVATRISEKSLIYNDLYPPEAVKHNNKKTYSESLGLMTERIAFLAQKGLEAEGNEKFWELSDPNGNPRFIKPNTGWGNGYWISMLWDSYRFSGDQRFMEWALKSNKFLLGNEDRPSMVAGLDYWNGSVRSFKETGDSIWRESALRNAECMYNATINSSAGLMPVSVLKDRKDLDNPYKDLIYAKVDAMICIPILFWAYQETKDVRYLEAGRMHALNTKKYLIEQDGSAFQLSWHDPGTGDLIGVGTNQGLGGNSRWARGQAWVPDGFADAYILSGDREFAEIFRKSADWLIKNLPSDYIPWYDYDDQGVFYRYRDTSAPAISAYALLRMSDVEPDGEMAKKYRDFGIKIVNALIDNYLTKIDEEDVRPPGMLSHQCYVKHFDTSGEQIWGSFNLMRALMWLNEKGIERK